MERTKVTLSPIIYILGLMLITVPVAVLALRPAFPHNRLAEAIWVGGLILATGIFVWAYFIRPRNTFDFWIAPGWYPYLVGFAMIVIPFGTSYLLWRQRAKETPSIGAGVATLVCAAVCIAAFIGMSTFNRSCVYFDYYHDGGQAWCPASWEATLGTNGVR